MAASATCQNQACDRVALKIVNFSSYRQRIAGAHVLSILGSLQSSPGWFALVVIE